MNSFLVKQFIMNLTNEGGIKFAKKYNVIFTLDEAKIIVPFLKKHVNYVNVENKEKLLSLLKKEVANNTYMKAVKLIDNLI